MPKHFLKDAKTVIGFAPEFLVSTVLRNPEGDPPTPGELGILWRLIGAAAMLPADISKSSDESLIAISKLGDFLEAPEEHNYEYAMLMKNKLLEYPLRDLRAVSGYPTKKKILATFVRLYATEINNRQLMFQMNIDPDRELMAIAMNVRRIAAANPYFSRVYQSVEFDLSILSKFKSRHSLPVILRMIVWSKSKCSIGLERARVKRSADRFDVFIPIYDVPRVLGLDIAGVVPSRFEESIRFIERDAFLCGLGLTAAWVRSGRFVKGLRLVVRDLSTGDDDITVDPVFRVVDRARPKAEKFDDGLGLLYNDPVAALTPDEIQQILNMKPR